MRKTRTGNKLVSRRACAAAVLALIFAAASIPAWGSRQSKQAPAAYAVVTGTVFRETGMALAGADVTLTAAGDSQNARKSKKMHTVTSPRGEFVFRLPAAPMQYTLRVSASGYQPQEKPVSISAEDQVDVFFKLEPASK